MYRVHTTQRGKPKELEFSTEGEAIVAAVNDTNATAVYDCDDGLVAVRRQSRLHVLPQRLPPLDQRSILATSNRVGR